MVFAPKKTQKNIDKIVGKNKTSPDCKSRKHFLVAVVWFNREDFLKAIRMGVQDNATFNNLSNILKVSMIMSIQQFYRVQLHEKGRELHSKFSGG